MFKSSDASLYADAPKKQTTDSVETVVGPSVVVEGDFSSDGNILVKGTVSGNVKTAQRLTVEEGAKILANVKAGEAFISGEIKGNVRIEDRLELTETARILGDITCETLIVHAGALIHGKLVMKGLEKAKPAKKITSRTTRKRAASVEKSESLEEESSEE